MANDESRVIEPKGLVSLAMLKALYDERCDHLEMVRPIIEEVVSSLATSDFTSQDVARSIIDTFRLRVPSHTVQLLLDRMAASGSVRFEGGKYFKNAIIPSQGVLIRMSVIQDLQRTLARQLYEFSQSFKNKFVNEEDALRALFDFLSRNQVLFILDEDCLPQQMSAILNSPEAVATAEDKTVARFVLHMMESGRETLNPLKDIVDGYVLQNALFLKDVDFKKRSFANLTVIIDTGFVFSALGLYGPLAEKSSRETLDIIRSAGATFIAFSTTIREMQRILHVYEDRLGTPSGIESLKQTDLTRYFLTNRFTPAMVKELSVRLEHKLRLIGLDVREHPARVKELTLGEGRLSELLARPGADPFDYEPRVRHDVDCVASVLVMRNNAKSSAVEDTVAIFATTTGQVINKVRLWYAEMQEEGIPPAISVSVLANRAWLKRPGATSTLNLDQLVAFCAAAIKPPKATWQRFVDHLRKMKEEGSITSDEEVAVLVSSFTDSRLSRLDEDVKVETEVIEDILKRVKSDLNKESEEAIARLHRENSERQEEQDRKFEEKERVFLATQARAEAAERSIADFSMTVSRALAMVLLLPVQIAIALGLTFGLPWLLPDGGGGHLLVLVLIWFAWLFSVVSLFLPGHFQDLLHWLSGKIQPRVQGLVQRSRSHKLR